MTMHNDTRSRSGASVQCSEDQEAQTGHSSPRSPSSVTWFWDLAVFPGVGTAA